MNRLSEIAQLENLAKTALARVDAIRNACRHQWAPSDAKYPLASSPLCSLCGQGGYGWWCEGSPDKTCDYNHDDPPGGPLGKIYIPDRCRYCGKPEERK